MPKYQLRITPIAQVDIENIINYGKQHWGAAQSDKYLHNVKEKLWLLTEQPFLGLERPELLGGLRSLNVATHCIYYRVTDSYIDIIRLLHQRQDVTISLK